jgi:hypothetical protein
MATKGGKSKASKRATQEQTGAAKLRRLIEDVIDAQHRGDPKLRDEAVEALGKFTGPEDLRRHAADARAAASNAVSADSVRLLNDIAGRLDIGKPA